MLQTERGTDKLRDGRTDEGHSFNPPPPPWASQMVGVGDFRVSLGWDVCTGWDI